MRRLINTPVKITFISIIIIALALISTGDKTKPFVTAQIQLPNFKLPYYGEEGIGWSGGPHEYENLETQGLFNQGLGSGLDFSQDPKIKHPSCNNNCSFIVRSMAEGDVIYVSPSNEIGSIGKMVAVQHTIGGSVIIYGHLYDIFPGLQEGDHIYQGSTIGHAGMTGTNNVHLHVELRDGSSTCSNHCIKNPKDLGGNPLSWHSKVIDEYRITEYRLSESEAAPVFNYDGAAVRTSSDVNEYYNFSFIDIDYPADSGITPKPPIARSNVWTMLPIDFKCELSNCEIKGIHDDVIFSNGGEFGGGGKLLSTNKPPESSIDQALFIEHISLEDYSVVAPGVAYIKTWRIKNTGSSIWGPGYQLVFISGDQLGAPATVNIPTTNPGEEVDISINITSPNQDGDYAGYWRLRHDGTYFGDPIWVKITVGSSAVDPSTDQVVSIQSVNSPDVVSPGQSFRPSITVKVNQGYLLENRGDLLRNSDGNLYGAYPHVAVTGTVSPGESYTFIFYEDDPIIAPASEGTYESKWRVWRNGGWVGPEIVIRFDVRVGGGTRPNAPTLSTPGNWSVFAESSPPALCVNAMAGVQYFFKIYDSHDIPESGWIINSCWTPTGLGPYGYQWHVKVRNSSTNVESDWSETRNFNLYTTQLSLTNLEFNPGSPSSSEGIRVYTCVSGFGGIGLGLKIEANTATDGSANGEWYWIHHLGKFCYDHNNTSTWPLWETLPLDDGDHLIRAVGFGPNGETIVKTAVYHLNRRKPNGSVLINPFENERVNNRTIDFQWKPSWRVNNYRLVIGLNSDPTISPLLDTTLSSSTTSFSYTFNNTYENIYWRVYAINELGSSQSSGHFGLDQSPPSSAVTNFSSNVSYETAFLVTWAGNDDRSGVRWYDVQFKDGDRTDSDWMDWMKNVTETSSIFIGQAGHTYYFRARALDVSGNLENWPSDPGDTWITIDPTAIPKTPWWNAAYGNKRNILILNKDPSPLSVGYPVLMHFDAGTTPSSTDLYAASLSASKGDDFRIIFNNSTELSRYVQTFSSNNINIWFNTKSVIGPNPASDAANYQLYYGNSTATTPPNNINNVLPPPLGSGTVGLWHFHDGVGTTFADSSGTNNNGTIYNGSWNSAGLFGSSASFNGSNTYAQIPSSSVFNLNNFTVEGYFKLTNKGTQSLVRRQMVSSTENAFSLEMRDWKIECRIRGAFSLISKTQLTPGQWYHVACSYDGSTVRLFINGTQESSYSFGDGTPASTGPVIIGRNPANSDYLQGEIQGIRISNIALTSFPHGNYAIILNKSSTAVGDPISPPITGSPDLAILNMNSYSNQEAEFIIQVTLMNQGDLATQNGFYTDLYVDHLPTGAGDYTGSIRFWVNDSIDPGEVVELTTLLPNSLMVTDDISPNIIETDTTLFAQTDSMGIVTEPDDQNNIYVDGLSICSASMDGFEDDDTKINASPVQIGEIQTHNSHRAKDHDWVSFSAQAGVNYLITTNNLGNRSDTYIYLYMTDGETLIASNDDNGETLGSQIEFTPTIDGKYYIKVEQWDPSLFGCKTNYDLSLVATTPPASFTKLTPVNGAFGLTPSPILTWSTSENATSYEYCYDTTNDNICNTWNNNGINTSVTLNSIVEGVPYYWQVRAINGTQLVYADNDVWWSFTAFNHSPNENEKLTSSKVTFSWFDTGFADSYKIQLSTKEDFSTYLLKTISSESIYQYPVALKYDKVYYWRIKSKVDGVWSKWGPTWQFESMDQLIKPILVLPAHKDILETKTVNLSWDQVVNAASYKVVIAKDSSFNVKVAKLVSTSNSATFDLDDGKYYWKVAPIDSSGVRGPWSDYRIFKVITLP